MEKEYTPRQGDFSKSIALIIPYFGKWPEYFDLYLHTVKKQNGLEVFLFTDLEYQKSLPGNVTKIDMTLAEFNSLASEKLGFEVDIRNPYKLCDFKPAYGAIFQDYIDESFTHWAFGDLDLIYGRLFELMPKHWEEYDVLSFREEWISGSLAVFRNNQKMNNLFKKSRFYIESFVSPKYEAFDECSGLFHILIKEGPDSVLSCDDKESFTWVVRSEELAESIKVYSKKIIKESISRDDHIMYDEGKITQKDGREFLYYHYITEKKTNAFHFPSWENVPERFYINRFGFFTEKEFTTWERAPKTVFRVMRGLRRWLSKLPGRVVRKISSVRR
jgi:hypothetical protein